MSERFSPGPEALAARVGFDPYAADYPEEHLFTFSGRGSVAPLPGTVMGIGAFYFPPVSGRGFRLSYDLAVTEPPGRITDSGRGEHYAPAQVLLQGCHWLPWGYRRRGLFHQRIGGKLISFRVESELIAPSSGDGVLLRLEFEVLSRLELEILPRLPDENGAFGICPPAAWNYAPPSARALLWSEGPKRWRVDGCTLTLLGSGMSETGSGWRVALEEGRKTSVLVGFSLEGKGLSPLEGDLEAHAASAREYWVREAAKVDARGVPEKYQGLFWRGWVTAMTARWERENFVASPYYASEGIDGGALCSYLWDLSYPSRFLAGLEGRALAGLIEAYLQPESFFQGYAISPIGGEWLGVFYAFQPYALTRIVSDYVEATGDHAWLDRTLGNGKTVFDNLETIIGSFDERYRTREGLLDFGHNRHLIELQVADYEGVVPNPNFEHVWTWRALERLGRLAGREPRPDLLERAERLKAACEARFWQPEQGWYFPTGAGRPIWSIQVLSPLRLGLFPREAVEAMARHLVSPRFLGPYGLYSVARDDEWHFNLTDADWGGGGCFTGHIGIILEGLARYGMNEAAEAILERLLWWGSGLPYIPQSTLADRPRLHGRVNAVAGAAICQALRALYPAEAFSGRM